MRKLVSAQIERWKEGCVLLGVKGPLGSSLAAGANVD